MKWWENEFDIIIENYLHDDEGSTHNNNSLNNIEVNHNSYPSPVELLFPKTIEMCYHLASFILHMCLLAAEPRVWCDCKMRPNTPKEFTGAPQRSMQGVLPNDKLLE